MNEFNEMSQQQQRYSRACEEMHYCGCPREEDKSLFEYIIQSAAGYYQQVLDIGGGGGVGGGGGGGG